MKPSLLFLIVPLVLATVCDGVRSADPPVDAQAAELKMLRWVIEHARPNVPDSFVAMGTAADGGSVSTATTGRVQLAGFDAPPEPFLVDESLATTGKTQRKP